MFCAGEARICSELTTLSVAGASTSADSLFDAETTTSSPRSAMPSPKLRLTPDVALTVTVWVWALKPIRSAVTL